MKNTVRDDDQAAVLLADDPRIDEWRDQSLSMVASPAGPRRCPVTGTSEAQREALGLPLASRGYQPLYERFLEVARQQLSAGAFAAAYAGGRALPLGQAVQEMLAAGVESLTVVPALPLAGIERHSPREREVAALIVEGYTNAKIAAVLGLAPRTAETHVRNILKKLGVGSRTEIRNQLASGVGNGTLST